jgi:hypothetical protein
MGAMPWGSRLMADDLLNHRKFFLGLVLHALALEIAAYERVPEQVEDAQEGCGLGDQAAHSEPVAHHFPWQPRGRDEEGLHSAPR